jgi:hypothetical protein
MVRIVTNTCEIFLLDDTPSSCQGFLEETDL